MQNPNKLLDNLPLYLWDFKTELGSRMKVDFVNFLSFFQVPYVKCPFRPKYKIWFNLEFVKWGTRWITNKKDLSKNSKERKNQRKIIVWIFSFYLFSVFNLHKEIISIFHFLSIFFIKFYSNIVLLGYWKIQSIWWFY